LAKQFYTILTAVGKAKIANAAALGQKVELTELALGDGGGGYYNPTEDQTELRNEVWRGAIGTVAVDEVNPTWITIQTVVPSQHGGFMIREAGVFDDEGDLIAVGKYPETYKPAAADGSIKDLVVRMILEVSNTASVVLKIDPTVILATQQQVDEAEARAKAYTDRKIGVAVPIGSIIPWTSTTIPDGWLECNGQAVSRTDFSELFAKIGTTFGDGDGSTTFNVPDLRGEFIRGWDNGRGVDSGREFGSWQADIFKSHNHVTDSRFDKLSARASDIDNQGTGKTFDAGYPDAEYRIGWMNDSLWASATIKTEGGPETRPRNVALMFIIKAKNVAGSDPAVQGANADTLDGYHASAFALSGHIHTDSSTIKPALNAPGDAPIYACRAWVNFDGYVTPPTIRASGNVSSVIRNETGNYIVNFTTPMPHSNYSATANYTNTNTAQAGENDGQAVPWDYQANFVRIFVCHGGALPRDGKIVSVSIHC